MDRDIASETRRSAEQHSLQQSQPGSAGVAIRGSRPTCRGGISGRAVAAVRGLHGQLGVLLSFSSWLRRRDLPICAGRWRRRQRERSERGTERWRCRDRGIYPHQGHHALPDRLRFAHARLGRCRRSRRPGTVRYDAGEIAPGEGRGAGAMVLERPIATAAR
jgi:hypothetical protein